MLYFDHVTCYLYWGNGGVDIGYNMNYIKVLKWSRDNLLSYVNYEKYLIYYLMVLTEKFLLRWNEIWKEFQILFKWLITIM